jgi:hypothetical protein
MGSNGTTVSDELQEICKELVTAYFMVLTQQLLVI